MFCPMNDCMGVFGRCSDWDEDPPEPTPESEPPVLIGPDDSDGLDDAEGYEEGPEATDWLAGGTSTDRTRDFREVRP